MCRFVEDLAGVLDRHHRIEADAELLLDQISHGHPGPRRREVDLVVADLHHVAAAERVFDGRNDHALDEIHHVGVVSEGLVGLQHREFGVVPDVDALVAKDPAELEDPFHASDDQPLQVQLEGDPQVHVDVEGVVMGDEWPRGGTALNAAEDRTFDLPEAVILQVAPDGPDRASPHLEDVAGPFVRHEVDVALAVAHLDVGESLVLVRRRPQRLAQHLETLDGDGDLALVGAHNAP